MISFSYSKIVEHIRCLLYMYYVSIPIKRKLHLHKVKKKALIKVVFFAANLSMWRYQHLYELMSKNSHFKIYIILTPFTDYSKEEQTKDIEELKNYFNTRKIPYIEADLCNIESDINPDILFYPQYYFNCLNSECDAQKFRNKLLCAYPYGFNNVYKPWAYNNFFHNVAWKLFYPTTSTLNEAKQLAFNKGKNVTITGYPNADDFLSTELNDVWKKQTSIKKRVIWAPHFTIGQEGSLLFFSTFLKFSSFMQDLSKKYFDNVQFAFKPHPALLTELYKHKNWGKEKTDEYYHWWEKQENTQLETGEFIDLFKSSDAIIHDCGSFSIEYLYTRNPAMYLCRNIEEIKKEKNEVGKNALDSHYIGLTEENVVNFIESVVLKNDDPMKEQREAFFNKYLLPPNGKTVAQNTMDDILKSLNIR